ncbi:uncharacterized protein TNCV_3173751 [Trichonephila clavipes]|nr:uncharacterized protein TNCV_3173751 [Trichonephila clavipes]
MRARGISRENNEMPLASDKNGLESERQTNSVGSYPMKTFSEGLPSEEDCDLIVLDDMMNNVTSEISQMFTVGSHHKKYSIILITQNLFPRVKSMRDISLNSRYIVLFRNNRDLSQASCFGRQAFPGRGKYFMDAYKKATENPFTYLLVDVHPRTPEETTSPPVFISR